MKISIPYHVQKKSSQDCGPVCVQMILEYFGKQKKLSELTKQLQYAKMGTSAYDNARLLLQEKLAVTAVTAHPMLFPADKIKKLTSKKILLKHLDGQAKKFKRFKPGIKLIKNFISADGKMKLEIPQALHIQNALDKGSLVLALLYAQALGSNEGGFHFIVISGYKKNKVYINNPSPYSQRQGWFPMDQFLYGLHASTCADIDNGTLLIVSKKR
jgi:hypothetical protein